MAATICNQKNWENTTNINRLLNISTEPLGPRHQPVPHAHALELFKERFAESGGIITKDTGLLSQDELKYIYTAEVEDPNISDFAFTLGFINFNNCTKAFTGLFGEKVFVCSNEMFTGETINDNKRHTTNVWGKLGGKINSIIERFNDFRKERLIEIDNMKAKKMTDKDAGEMLLNIFRNRIMSNTNVSRIVREWDFPTHPEFKEKNLWNFQQACTEVAKNIPDPNARIHATNSISGLIKHSLAA